MKHFSRRELLAGAGVTVLPARLWAQLPSRKLNLGFIGVGTRGLHECLQPGPIGETESG